MLFAKVSQSNPYLMFGFGLLIFFWAAHNFANAIASTISHRTLEVSLKFYCIITASTGTARFGSVLDLLMQSHHVVEQATKKNVSESRAIESAILD